MAGVPHTPDELAALATRLSASHRLVEAAEVARAGLAASPRHVRLVFEHAFALLKMGLAGEAVEALRRALARLPVDANLQMLLAFALNYDHRATAREVAAAHLAYGAALRRVVGKAAPARELARGRGEGARAGGAREAGGPGRSRKLRLGFVSADLRRHSVSYFLEPLLANLDRGRFEVVVLSSTRGEDEVTARLRGLADEWVDGVGLDHEAFAREAVARRLDVAIDLSGLTSGHRQAAFARRIAPVQVSYLGYPHASGVDTVTTRISDAIADPPEAANLMGETAVRLPRCFLAYRAPEDLPPVRERAGMGGVEGTGAGNGVVFGCFGNLAKINPAVIGVFARVLERVPGSRLVLKNHAFADRFLREERRGGTPTFLERLAGGGVDVSRMELRAPSPGEAEHLDAYNDVDVVLDTFPYNGTTTTCEALAMGVPVVTFAGASHAGRVGVSLLAALGRSEWCGESVEGMVEIAAGLGARVCGVRERLALRAEFLGSSLCDGVRLGREFGEAMERLAADPSR